MNHFGFIESESMIEYYKLLFDNQDKNIYELEKIETIKELEIKYNNILNEKTVVNSNKSKTLPIIMYIND